MSKRGRRSLRNTIAITVGPAIAIGYAVNEWVLGYPGVTEFLVGTALGFCLHYLVIQFQRTFM